MKLKKALKFIILFYRLVPAQKRNTGLCEQLRIFRPFFVVFGIAINSIFVPKS